MKSEEKMQRRKDYNEFIAICCAVVAIIFFSGRDFLLRYYRLYKEYPAFEFALDSLTLYSLGCVIYAIHLFYIQEEPFDKSAFYIGCMCSILNTLGFMMLGISVVIGYAGPPMP